MNLQGARGADLPQRISGALDPPAPRGASKAPSRCEHKHPNSHHSLERSLGRLSRPMGSSLEEAARGPSLDRDFCGGLSDMLRAVSDLRGGGGEGYASAEPDPATD